MTAAEVSVVLPVGGPHAALERCLESIANLDPPPGEVVVVLDGVETELPPAAEAIGVRVVRLAERCGPAVARNRGAAAARGSLLFFVDSDVELPAVTLGRALSALASDEQPAAVIGSYDDAPADPGLISQYRNLLHHWVHQQARDEASTFWGACGLIRREAFDEVGGFDERFARPSVEDIELGSRLRRAGYRIRLDKDLRVTHLKRWRALEMLRTDLWRRAVPWTELMLADGELLDDLNLRRRDRVSVALACAILPAAIVGCWWPPLWGAAAAAALALLVLNRDFYYFLRRRRGTPFALAALPWHWLYLLTCGAGFAIGWLRHALGRGMEPGR